MHSDGPSQDCCQRRDSLHRPVAGLRVVCGGALPVGGPRLGMSARARQRGSLPAGIPPVVVAVCCPSPRWYSRGHLGAPGPPSPGSSSPTSWAIRHLFGICERGQHEKTGSEPASHSIERTRRWRCRYALRAHAPCLKSILVGWTAWRTHQRRSSYQIGRLSAWRAHSTFRRPSLAPRRCRRKCSCKGTFTAGFCVSFVDADTEDRAGEFIARRPRYLLQREVFPGEMRLLRVRLRAVFHRGDDGTWCRLSPPRLSEKSTPLKKRPTTPSGNSLPGFAEATGHTGSM